MATHDYIISNASGAAVRSDLNNALAAIVSNNSAATEPTTTYAYMWWADTTAGQLKIRNAANDGWVVLQELDGTLLMEDGTVGAPGLAFAADTDTGFYRPADNELGIATGGTNAVYIDSTGNVGIGTTSPAKNLEISASTGATLRLNSSAAAVVANDVVGAVEYYANDSSAAGTGIAASIDAIVTSAFGQGGALRFSTRDEVTANATERARIDSSGRLLVGTSTSADAGSALQVASTSFGVAQLFRTGAFGASLHIGSTGTGTLASPSALANGEAAGYVTFRGYDSAAWRSGANIAAHADGQTWASGDCPTRLVFSTTADGASSPVERMRIAQDGANTITCGAVATGLKIVHAGGAGTSRRFFSGNYSSSTESFRVWTNGDVENTNNSYGAISDIKLKENIVDASSQWDDLKALQVRNYNFKEGQTHTQLGVIAQEVELVSPGLVTESPDTDDEGNDLGTTTKSVNYSVLYMKAVKALQEAMERIETLEANNVSLEARLAALEAN